jgi:hypothetical protein
MKAAELLAENQNYPQQHETQPKPRNKVRVFGRFLAATSIAFSSLVGAAGAEQPTMEKSPAEEFLDSNHECWPDTDPTTPYDALKGRTTNEALHERTGHVFMAYRGLLNRYPDRNGFIHWDQQQLPLDNLATEFTNAAEFRSKTVGISDQLFVGNLYSSILERLPDPTGSAYWEEQLTNGAMNEADIFKGFVRSPEFRARQQQDSFNIVPQG